jgi:hypothetical protein
MIVDDFHIVGKAIGPAEANSPLIVDPDAELSLAIAAQRFESVSRRHAQFVECVCCVQHLQLSARNPFDTGESPDEIVIEKLFCIATGEAPDHEKRLFRQEHSVKQNEDQSNLLREACGEETNTKVRADFVAPFGGAAFHDTKVWMRAM